MDKKNKDYKIKKGKRKAKINLEDIPSSNRRMEYYKKKRTLRELYLVSCIKKYLFHHICGKRGINCFLFQISFNLKIKSLSIILLNSKYRISFN